MLGLGVGSSLTVEQAIRVIAVKSANDIAAALAEKIAGSETAFAAQMTGKARSLGMMNTHFANASGLPNARHLTTARDIRSEEHTYELQPLMRISDAAIALKKKT